MPMESAIGVIDVNQDNVSREGFFCLMSKRKSEGYQRKLRWLKDRFAQGMKIKIIKEGGRGFIEYIPGEYAWRAVRAEGYMFIHCLWVVGKSKGKGCGTFLLNECIKGARDSGMKGVAMVTSKGNWLAGKKLLQKTSCNRGRLPASIEHKGASWRRRAIGHSKRTIPICSGVLEWMMKRVNETHGKLSGSKPE